jgi:hypothetical protein
MGQMVRCWCARPGCQGAPVYRTKWIRHGRVPQPPPAILQPPSPVEPPAGSNSGGCTTSEDEGDTSPDDGGEYHGFCQQVVGEVAQGRMTPTGADAMLKLTFKTYGRHVHQSGSRMCRSWYMCLKETGALAQIGHQFVDLCVACDWMYPRMPSVTRCGRNPNHPPRFDEAGNHPRKVRCAVWSGVLF